MANRFQYVAPIVLGIISENTKIKNVKIPEATATYPEPYT